MPQYKVTYFPIRGYAEVVRQILVVSGQDFEDERITREKWLENKERFPFHQVPVLEEDGKQLAQSYAISRYLARKYNLAGANPWEEAQVDSYADQWKDFFLEFRPFIIVYTGFGQGDLDKLRAEVLVPAIKKHFPFFVKALKNSSSGYLVGDGLTWVDLAVSDMLTLIEEMAPEEVNNYPEMKAHQTKVRTNPKLQKWIDTRPDSEYLDKPRA